MYCGEGSGPMRNAALTSDSNTSLRCDESALDAQLDMSNWVEK